MGLLHSKAVSNKHQTLENIIGLTTNSVSSLLHNQGPGRHEIAFKHKLLGINTEQFVIGVGAKVLEDLKLKGAAGWSFDLEASKEIGQVEVKYPGYNFNKNRIWDRPALVFLREEVVERAMAEVIQLPVREELVPLVA